MEASQTLKPDREPRRDILKVITLVFSYIGSLELDFQSAYQVDRYSAINRAPNFRA